MCKDDSDVHHPCSTLEYGCADRILYCKMRFGYCHIIIVPPLVMMSASKLTCSPSVFTVKVTEAINIAGPVAEEVDRAIHSPLDDLPLTVHIAVHLEGSTTTWVNGVHSRGGATTIVNLLAVTREMLGALSNCKIRQIIVRNGSISSFGNVDRI